MFAYQIFILKFIENEPTFTPKLTILATILNTLPESGVSVLIPTLPFQMSGHRT